MMRTSLVASTPRRSLLVRIIWRTLCLWQAAWTPLLDLRGKKKGAVAPFFLTHDGNDYRVRIFSMYSARVLA